MQNRITVISIRGIGSPPSIIKIADFNALTFICTTRHDKPELPTYLVI